MEIKSEFYCISGFVYVTSVCIWFLLKWILYLKEFQTFFKPLTPVTLIFSKHVKYLDSVVSTS